MYRFKDKDAAKIYNKTQMASVVGLAPETVRRITNGSQPCSKVIAYCITKFLNNDAEIEKYFDKEGE